jgi:outer membrane protein TolC
MKIISVLFLITLAESLAAQPVLTLPECHERAMAHYPLIRQRELLETSKSYSLDNAAKGYFPLINIGGQATYQSEVTQIPVEMPGVDPLDKDQYRIYGEIAQTLYHGGAVDRRTRVEEAKADVEERELETELYQLKNRINELFFGILLVQEQIRQLRLMRRDITSGINRIEVLIRNGTAIQASSHKERNCYSGIGRYTSCRTTRRRSANG